MKYNVYEMVTDVKPIGYAEEIKPGEIHIKLKNKTLILIQEKIKQPFKKGFENKFTTKVKNTYQNIPFKKEAIKEITYFLNEGYKDSYTTKSLKSEIKQILEKYKHNSHLKGYINYFVESGMLTSVKGSNIYNVKRTKLIPKRKKDVDLGILDELGM